MIKKIIYKLQAYGLKAIPTFTVIISIFLTSIPFQVSNASILTPMIVQAVIYYWSVYYPKLLPYLCLLLLGLFKDIVEVNTLGINAVTFLLFRAIITSQRKYFVNHDFVVVWAGFAFCLGVILLLPVILNIYSNSLMIVLSQWLISIFAYVPIHW